MNMKTTISKPDKQTGKIYRALKAAFPNLPDEQTEVVRKSNRYTIRVCVVDESFAEMSLEKRHIAVKKALSKLDPEDREHISFLMMLSPEEAEEESAEPEFHDW
jgi:stress-induced morphogen